jgi:hypothetical protein
LRSVPRTVYGDDITFDDEKTLPKLNNLASHVTECKKKNGQSDDDSGDEKISEKLKLKESAKFMADYLKEGLLNPQIIATYKGFLRLFTAWILDESLPWTTGEAPALAVLFKYLKVHFALPSDTTVRNQLAHIFAELHAKVVTELTVCVPLIM